MSRELLLSILIFLHHSDSFLYTRYERGKCLTNLCLKLILFLDSGVLVIVMNYTGDILNFGLAIEEARAHDIDVSNNF